MENSEQDGNAAKPQPQPSENNAATVPTPAVTVAQPRNGDTANGSGDGACNLHTPSNAVVASAATVANGACSAQPQQSQAMQGPPNNTAATTHLTTRSANHQQSQRDRSKDRRNPARDHNRNRLHNTHGNRSSGNGATGYLTSVSQTTRNQSRNSAAEKQDDGVVDRVQAASSTGDLAEASNAAGAAPNQAQGAAAQAAIAMQYNWQSSKPTLKERLLFMFNNEIMADVHFVVGRGSSTQRIPAHKFVLSIGSAVFDAMFNGGMATKSDDVELPDVEASAFHALLRFLYSDEVHIGPETVMTTLYTAKKYAVPALEKACVDFLKRNLSSDNAFMLLTQARLFDEPQLAALCLEVIDKNTSEAVNAEGFTDIDIDTLCVVLERDTLGIRECKLFNAVCRWGEAECIRQNYPVNPENQRLVLGRALQLIRFPLMTVEEFAQGAAQSCMLNDREVVELFLHFTVNPKPAVNFLDVPRCCLTGREQVVSRFCQIESRWGYSGTSDRIRFMVNRKIFVVGFGLYGSIHGATEYAVTIQIIHTETGNVCGQNETSFQCDGSSSTFRVIFKEPVEIQPNTSYTACSTLKGPDSYYGTKGLRKVTHESVTSGKVTFQFTYAAGNNNGTSVEDGQIPEIIFCT